MYKSFFSCCFFLLRPILSPQFCFARQNALFVYKPFFSFCYFLEASTIAAGVFFCSIECVFGVRVVFFICFTFFRPILSPQALFFVRLSAFSSWCQSYCRRRFVFDNMRSWSNSQLFRYFCFVASPIAAGFFFCLFFDEMRVWGDNQFCCSIYLSLRPALSPQALLFFDQMRFGVRPVLLKHEGD